MDANVITNVVGAVGSAAMAAQPILNGIQGNLHHQDYVQLLTAIAFSVISFFTGRKTV